MNRQEAVALCLKTYVPDRPCKNGHSLRYTSGMNCAICRKPEKSAEKKMLLDAIEKGLKVYSTGKPCKNGHITDRYVRTRTCKECNKNSAKRHRDMENIEGFFLSEETANLLGLPRFFTALPCQRGHTSERYTKSRGCVACKKGYRENTIFLPVSKERIHKDDKPAPAYIPKKIKRGMFPPE